MLGQLTAQFAIVRVPEHRGYRNLLLARLISALGTWTAFFAVRIAIYNQTGSVWWVSILLFCELVPSVILGIAIGPLIDRWPRQRMMIFSDLGGAATFAVLPFVHSPAAICALSAVAGFSAAFFRPGVLLGDPESRARGIPRRGERARAGRREHRDADRAGSRGRRRRAARLEHGLRAQRRQLPRLGAAPPADRQSTPVDRAGPDRPHALARGTRRALARAQRPLPVVDRPDLELGDARLRRHQRGRDRAHDGRVRRRAVRGSACSSRSPPRGILLGNVARRSGSSSG